MALFRREDTTSDMNPQITRWGKLVLVALGTLTIAGLVIGTFIYGSRQTTIPPPTQTEQTVTPAADSEPSQTNEQSATPVPSDEVTQPRSLPSQSAPTTGPQAVPTTGPQDWVPYIATALVLLGWQLRHSRRQLGIAQRTL